MKFTFHLIKILVSIYVIFIAASCQASTKQLDIYNDPDEMEKEILQFISPGSLISDAERVMVQNGFKCQHINNTPYSKWRKPSGVSIEAKTIRYKPSDVLSCQRTQSFLIARTKWYVTVAYKNQHVSNVAVSVDSTGP